MLLQIFNTYSFQQINARTHLISLDNLQMRSRIRVVLFLYEVTNLILILTRFKEMKYLRNGTYSIQNKLRGRKNNHTLSSRVYGINNSAHSTHLTISSPTQIRDNATTPVTYKIASPMQHNQLTRLLKEATPLSLSILPFAQSTQLAHSTLSYQPLTHILRHTVYIFILLSFLNVKEIVPVWLLCRFLVCVLTPPSTFEPIERCSRNFGINVMPLEATPTSHFMISYNL
jgi:hypothetical protein